MILALKWSYMTFEVIHMKKMSFHNVDISEKFLSDQALNKKYIAEKEDFEHLI